MIPRIVMPIWLGIVIETAGIAAGIAILLQVTPSNTYLFNLILLLTAFLLLWYFPHSLAHYIVGQAVGVKFSNYYLSVSSLSRIDKASLSRVGRMVPMLGVRIDKTSLRRVSPVRRSAMYVSGVLASMLIPLLCVYTSFSVGTPVLALLLTVIWVVNGVFTLYFSPKVGDISRAVKTRLET